MFRDFYGLAKQPFEATSDPCFLQRLETTQQ